MTSPPHDKPVVLVVDDEILVRMVASDALQDAGCATYEAAEAEEALALVEDHPEISVLFTDINMPGLDGLALARLVHARRPDMRLILTSGRERPSAAEIPDDGRFIPKPYDTTVVTQLVHELNVADATAAPTDADPSDGQPPES